MNNSSYEFLKPKVKLRMYLPEILLLSLSFATPALVWLIWKDGSILARSGSLMVFFAAVAEFKTLNRMSRKHLLNAGRVSKGEVPWDFSNVANVVGIASLLAALTGTILWGYGDLIIIKS